ncbi:hypothetical protein [Roseimaritima sediminicola]|uniref:hypothetical protein n=1 Tax=Roseimaritima sediminicola TaxID=2662066 RepID=UPI00129825B8|nr:hypothetical protein [Roseimaritima sediminicola]
MQILAEHLVELADRQAITPVLFPQPGLRLRASFYLALAEVAVAIAGRDVRFEFVVDPQRWTSGAQRLSLRRLSNRIQAQGLPTVSAKQVAVVGRPAGAQRPLGIGVACSEVALPAWAAAVRVCTRPTEAADFQLVVA